MKHFGFFIFVTIIVGIVLGSISAFEAVIMFLLAGLIPGTDFAVAPLVVFGSSFIIAGAFWLPHIVERLLFPVDLNPRTLPKNRYAKL